MLSDILDGYFPYELKAKYKDGVPLKVVDHTEEKYEEKAVAGSAPQNVQDVITQKQAIPASLQTIEVETHVIKAEKEGKKFESTELATLRIRTENGKQFILLKLLSTDTIKTVYDYVKKYSENPSKFSIRTTFPKKEYQISETKTLKELGLTPTAALVMQ